MKQFAVVLKFASTFEKGFLVILFGIFLVKLFNTWIRIHNIIFGIHIGSKGSRLQARIVNITLDNIIKNTIFMSVLE